MNWFIYVLSDSLIVGTVSWLGLLVTTGGFGVGIWQLRKIRKASNAAAAAVDEIKGLTKSRSSLADLVAAVSLLETIKAHLVSHNFDISIVYLDQLRARVVSAKRLLRLDEKERERFELSLSLLRKLTSTIKELAKKPKKETDTSSVFAILDEVSDSLNHYLAPLRFEQEADGD